LLMRVMSLMASVFVRPAGPFQRRDLIVPVSLSRRKQRREDVGITIDCRGSGTLVAQAGLGRYSGAIHGNRSKKHSRWTPSETSQDDKDMDKFDDQGAPLRGAYGDQLNKRDSTGYENQEKSVVDQFHSDGTSEHNSDGMQFQQSSNGGNSTNQSVKIDQSTGGIDVHCDQVTEPKSDVGNSNLSPEDHKVEPIAVLDGSGHETRSYVSSNLEDSQGQDGVSNAENGGIEDRGTRDEKDGTTRNSVERNRAEAEAGPSQSVAHSLDSKSANHGSGGFDSVRTGNTKPAIQRRRSRGRRKRMPNLASESPPMTFFPEEVAPVAATVLTNPEVFADFSENYSATADDVKSVAVISKVQSSLRRLKAYDVKGKQKNAQMKGTLSTTDTTWVRSPGSNAERPARTAGSMSAASSDVIALEPAREDISASGQTLQFDMNEMNGHIKQRKGRIGIITSLPRLLRPKPSNDVTSQGPALNGSAASAQTDGRVKFLGSPALASSENEKLETSLTSPLELVAEIPSKIAELPAVNFVKDLPEMVKEKAPVVAELTTVVAELPAKAVLETAQILKEQVVDPVVEVLPDEVVEQVSSQVDEVSSQVVESVTETVQATATMVSSKAAEVMDFLISDEDDTDSDDEFETFKTSDAPEFRGMQGLNNFDILQEDIGIFYIIYDFYIYMLKKPLPEFATAMFVAPVLLSVIFTFLYLPDVQGLAFDDTARNFFDAASGDVTSGGLSLSWSSLFEVFMFSLSLSTGLQPEIAPLSPYTLVLANVNALFAQLIFVFLSGAVFARLSQPSQPVRCSTVALICPSLAQRRKKVDACSATKVLMARYVLAGPQPCELVDVKVDLTYKYNTLTRSGSFFRATQSLKLVRSEIAYLNHGMLVRHIIDESSPLYRRTPEMLRREDSIFALSIVGLERSSMQSVFHVQHYCVSDNDVIWDAEFEDMMLINKKNRRIIDHSKLSLWRPV